MMNNGKEEPSSSKVYFKVLSLPADQSFCWEREDAISEGQTSEEQGLVHISTHFWCSCFES